MLRLLRLISYPQLRASWGRTALVIGGVATGISLIVAINIINASVLSNFQRMIERIAGPAQLQVAFGIGELGFDESVVATVRADSAVAAAVPLVRGTIALASEPGTTLQLFGVDLTAEEDLKRYEVTTTNRREILDGMHDPSSILLTSAFANRRNLEIGDSVALSMPTGVRDFIVRGLLDASGIASVFGGQLLIMDLPAAQLALAKEGRIDQLDIVLADGSDIEEVQRRLQAVLPSTLTVMRPAQRGAEYDHVLSGRFRGC